MLLGRSTFCQNQPVSDSKKPTRALSVSMQIFFPNLLQPLADMKYHVSGICEPDFQTFGHNTP